MNKPTIFTLILIVVAIVVVGGYFYMQGSQPTSSSSALVSSDTTASGPSDSGNILALLNQVKSLNIDTAFFQTPAYTSLTSYSVNIIPISVGNRTNPFAPVSGIPSPFSTGVVTQVATSSIKTSK